MAGGLSWIVAAALCAGLVEIGLRLPFPRTIADMTTAGRKAARTAASRRISDHWKEKAMGAYARTTFAATVQLAAMIVVLLGGAAFLVVSIDTAGLHGFSGFMTGALGLAFSCVFACLYAWLRLRRSAHVRL